MKRIVLLGVVLAAAACREEPKDRIQRSGEPDFFLGRKNDVEMEAAIARARKTVPEFAAALAAPTPGRDGFAVKKRYVEGGKTEYIWHQQVRATGDGAFHARVANEPVWIHSLKVGEWTRVGEDEVADWMYVEDGKLVGGFTLRVILAREPPERRRELEKELGFEVTPLK